MKYIIDGIEYEIIVIKKNNKNTYIRVKDDMSIVVTTGYFTTKKQILEILRKNEIYLRKMLNNMERRVQKQKFFYYLGKKYDIIIMPGQEVVFDGDYVYVENLDVLEKWYKKRAKELFLEHLNEKYKVFEESIPYPVLKIRKMKTRWGVCNRRNISVTLNLDLMKYDIEALDYVIIHELSHFVHFNHSKAFWELVSKYTPDYKRIKKVLKDE